MAANAPAAAAPPAAIHATPPPPVLRVKRRRRSEPLSAAPVLAVAVGGGGAFSARWSATGPWTAELELRAGGPTTIEALASLNALDAQVGFDADGSLLRLAAAGFAVGVDAALVLRPGTRLVVRGGRVSAFALAAVSGSVDARLSAREAGIEVQRGGVCVRTRLEAGSLHVRGPGHGRAFELHARADSGDVLVADAALLRVRVDASGRALLQGCLFPAAADSAAAEAASVAVAGAAADAETEAEAEAPDVAGGTVRFVGCRTRRDLLVSANPGDAELELVGRIAAEVDARWARVSGTVPLAQADDETPRVSVESPRRAVVTCI